MGNQNSLYGDYIMNFGVVDPSCQQAHCVDQICFSSALVDSHLLFP
jgi:hypothetical protein